MYLRHYWLIMIFVIYLSQRMAPHMCHGNLKLSLDTAPSNILPAVQCTHNLMDLLKQW